MTVMYFNAKLGKHADPDTKRLQLKNSCTLCTMRHQVNAKPNVVKAFGSAIVQVCAKAMTVEVAEVPRY